MNIRELLQRVSRRLKRAVSDREVFDVLRESMFAGEFGHQDVEEVIKALSPKDRIRPRVDYPIVAERQQAQRIDRLKEKLSDDAYQQEIRASRRKLGGIPEEGLSPEKRDSDIYTPFWRAYAAFHDAKSKYEEAVTSLVRVAIEGEKPLEREAGGVRTRFALLEAAHTESKSIRDFMVALGAEARRLGGLLGVHMETRSQIAQLEDHILGGAIDLDELSVGPSFTVNTKLTATAVYADETRSDLFKHDVLSQTVVLRDIHRAKPAEISTMLRNLQQVLREVNIRNVQLISLVSATPKMSWVERKRVWNQLYPERAYPSEGAMRKAYARAETPVRAEDANTIN